jgi:hypothetical protein
MVAGTVPPGQRCSGARLATGKQRRGAARPHGAPGGVGLLQQRSHAPNRVDAWLDRRSSAAATAHGGAGVRAASSGG